MLALRPDMQVHARSAFLQGLLTPAAPERWPAIPGVDAGETVAALNRLAQALNRESVRDLCIAFVRSRPWVRGVVVGVETLGQLHENLGLFRRPPLRQAEAEIVRGRLPKVPETLLNPHSGPRPEPVAAGPFRAIRPGSRTGPAMGGGPRRSARAAPAIARSWSPAPGSRFRNPSARPSGDKRCRTAGR